ncbi:prepilin-type N-terminal cleavage/methylation domain-containing protein [Hydrocarboniphaga effusa]|uniref:prepilin-type N-terminal cleavage/methylation domain-containing protein n=1 Tax=Hydrocarboniphaga effusa TaxID=243629 RepID=UPI0031377275
MNRLRAHRRDRGETLIGVLIALSIGLIVVGTCLSPVAVATRAQMKLDAAIERGEAERLKLE